MFLKGALQRAGVVSFSNLTQKYATFAHQMGAVIPLAEKAIIFFGPNRKASVMSAFRLALGCVDRVEKGLGQGLAGEGFG